MRLLPSGKSTLPSWSPLPRPRSRPLCGSAGFASMLATFLMVCGYSRYKKVGARRAPKRSEGAEGDYGDDGDDGDDGDAGPAPLRGRARVTGLDPTAKGKVDYGMSKGGLYPLSHGRLQSIHIAPARTLCCVFLSLMGGARAVECPYCMDTIVPAHTGETCPLVTSVATNREAFAAGRVNGDLALSDLLPPRLLSLFPSSVCRLILGLSTAPTGGRTVDFSDGNYPTAGDVVRSVFYSHSTPEEAQLELMGRMDAAGDADEMTRLKTAVDLLKTKEGISLQGISGVYSFVWAKVSMHAQSSNLLRLQTPSASKGASSSDMTAKLYRPTTHQEFLEIIFLYVWVLVAMGVANFAVMMQFFDDVVWRPMRELDLTWQVAYELVMTYIEEIERDVTRSLHFANVYARGKHDTLLAKARASSAAFFRTRGGTPRAGGPTPNAAVTAAAKTWNGKFTAGASRACVAYNRGLAHLPANLADDGTCVHDHVCMQFVSDKGKGGQCRGAHRFTECDYEPSKKRQNAQP